MLCGCGVAVTTEFLGFLSQASPLWISFAAISMWRSGGWCVGVTCTESNKHCIDN